MWFLLNGLHFPVLSLNKSSSLQLSDFFRVVSWCLLFSRLLARPAWTYGRSKWSDISIYPQTNAYLINDRWDSLICGVLLFILIMGVGLEVMYHWDETVVTHADELNNYVNITEEENVEESEKLFVVHAAIADSLMKDDLKAVNRINVENTGDRSSRGSRGSRVSAASAEFMRLQGARESRFSSAASVPDLISAKSVTPLMQRVAMFIFLIAAFLIVTVTSSKDALVSGLIFAFAPVCVLWFDTYAYRKMKNLVFVIPG
jgi:hypothetical protein